MAEPPGPGVGVGEQGAGPVETDAREAQETGVGPDEAMELEATAAGEAEEQPLQAEGEHVTEAEALANGEEETYEASSDGNKPEEDVPTDDGRPELEDASNDEAETEPILERIIPLTGNGVVRDMELPEGEAEAAYGYNHPGHGPPRQEYEQPAQNGGGEGKYGFEEGDHHQPSHHHLNGGSGGPEIKREPGTGTAAEADSSGAGWNIATEGHNGGTEDSKAWNKDNKGGIREWKKSLEDEKEYKDSKEWNKNNKEWNKQQPNGVKVKLFIGPTFQGLYSQVEEVSRKLIVRLNKLFKT